MLRDHVLAQIIISHINEPENNINEIIFSIIFTYTSVISLLELLSAGETDIAAVKSENGEERMI